MRCCLLGLLASCTLVLAASPIPPERCMDWSVAGVPGGIPHRTQIFVNVATTDNPAYRCAADGTADCSPALQRALNDCPAEQVVYLPKGIYRLDGRVRDAHRGHVTLRGDGPGATILKSSVKEGNAPLCFGDSDWPRPTKGEAITAGATRGSTAVTVADTSRVNVGKLVRIDPVNPPWVHNLNGENDHPTMSFTFKVVAKTLTSVTLTPPLPFDLSAMSPKLVPYSPLLIEGIGIEDLSVDLDGTRTPAAFVETAWGCWFTHVEIVNSGSRQLLLYTFCAGEISGCFTHGTRSGGPNHEGIDFFIDSCWNLVQDNIVVNGGFPGIILGDSKGGCQGNVIAYNYGSSVNSGGPDTTGADISFSHGSHNMLNLAEGNVVTMINADGYYGSSSHNTLFRNCIKITHPTATDGLRGVALGHFNTYYNVVGNVLGTPDFPGAPHGRYDIETPSYRNGTHLIYQLGYPNLGNTFHDGTRLAPASPPDYRGQPFTLPKAQALDLNVKATLLRWGNFDYATHTTRWESSEVPGDVPVPPDHDLPASLYLRAKPEWWGDLPWPPIGPDLSPMVSAIPAQVRFERDSAGR
jgi:hypothetical protein